MEIFYDRISAIYWTSARTDYMDDGDVVMDVRDAASCHARSKNEARSKVSAP